MTTHIKPQSIKRQIKDLEKKLIVLSTDIPKFTSHFDEGQSEVEFCVTVGVPKSLHDHLKETNEQYSLAVNYALDASEAYWDKMARETSSSDNEAWKAIYAAKRLHLDEARQELNERPLPDINVTVHFDSPPNL